MKRIIIDGVEMIAVPIEKYQANGRKGAQKKYATATDEQKRAWTQKAREALATKRLTASP